VSNQASGQTGATNTINADDLADPAQFGG